MAGLQCRDDEGAQTYHLVADPDKGTIRASSARGRMENLTVETKVNITVFDHLKKEELRGE